jgi:hypothetical protein
MHLYHAVVRDGEALVQQQPIVALQRLGRERGRGREREPEGRSE